MFDKPQAEHEILGKLVGSWKAVTECKLPDGSTEKSEGQLTFRSLGGLWVIGEGVFMQGPGGEDVVSQFTIGYDASRKLYVGSYLSSCMTKLWIYDGEYDAAGKKLVLTAQGPRFDGKPGETLYHDVVEYVSDDHFILWSEVQGEDGSWTKFMTCDHFRVK
jgi:hypothetical protein